MNHSTIHSSNWMRVTLMVGALLWLAGCMSTSHELDHSKRSSSSEMTVTLTVIGDDRLGTILPPSTIETDGQATVLDVLLAAAEQHQLAVDYSGQGMMAYIQAISGLHERDRGPKSGWQFRVNGKLAEQGAGSYRLHDQDEITWFFSVDYTRDAEAQP